MAGSVASSRHICALCTTPARYKCPRCAAPSCSLPCSRKHRQDTGCTGERDAAQYVPMNAYDWGTMMRDYCYLENVGRKVSEWGSDIVRGGYATNIGASTRRSSGGRKSTTGRSKRDLLRAHLETLDIDVELLPAGMERRNLNQSTFNQKSRRPLLTLELVFHPPSTISSSLPSCYKTLSHRNSLSATLLSILQRQASSISSKSQKQKENYPDWLLPMVTPHPEAPEHFVHPLCYIRANTDFPHAPNVPYYHRLEPTLALSELLRKTSFVEFPTILVFDPEASPLVGTVIDKSGLVVRVSENDRVEVTRVAKRRRLNEAAGLNAISALIGGYGSDASPHSEEEENADIHQTALATLESYSGSDDAGYTDAEEDQSNSGGDIPADGSQLDPTKLLEFMEQARSAADEDVLDWGDEWDTDAER